jgi:hypothetical protein
LAQLKELDLFERYRQEAVQQHPDLAQPQRARRLLYEAIRRMLSEQVYDLIAATQALLAQARPGSADEARDAAVENEPGEIRYRTIRVRVGEKPLILRTAPAKGSAPIGRLLPGQVVTVLEEHISADGEVRACVS